MSNLRIACTAFGTIKAGKVDKAGRNFTGQTQDVTSDALKAVIEKIQIDNRLKDNTNEKKFEIVINVEGRPKYELALTVL